MSNTPVILTRSKRDSLNLSKHLKSVGIKSFIEPLLEIEQNLEAKDRALDLLQRGYNNVLITSGNAIDSLLEIDLSKTIEILCIGVNTAQKLEEVGYSNVKIVGDNIEELLKNFSKNFSKEKNYLYLSGNLITKDLDVAGYNIKRLEVYKTIYINRFSEEFKRLIKSSNNIYILIYSKNAMDKMTNLLAEEGLVQYIVKINVFCLSENIAKSAEKFGFSSVNYPKTPNTNSLLALIKKFYFTAH